MNTEVAANLVRVLSVILVLSFAHMECAFCTDPNIKNRIVGENDFALAFLTKTPITPGHTLVIPKRHVPEADQLTEEELVAIFALRSAIAKALTKTFDAAGFNFAWNESELAGQSVPHMHLHIVPRKEGDSGIYEYEPRKFLYRPGSRADTPQTELAEVATVIREAA